MLTTLNDMMRRTELAEQRLIEAEDALSRSKRDCRNFIDQIASTLSGAVTIYDSDTHVQFDEVIVKPEAIFVTAVLYVNAVMLCSAEVRIDVKTQKRTTGVFNLHCVAVDLSLVAEFVRAIDERFLLLRG